eukprot:COSAG05_NODE_7883_length_759_cov_5.675758_1_plen_81_part_10
MEVWLREYRAAKKNDRSLVVRSIHNNAIHYYYRNTCSHGIIYDVDNDHQGNTLWGVQWSNGDKSDFDINEMRKYCVLQQHG